MHKKIVPWTKVFRLKNANRDSVKTSFDADVYRLYFLERLFEIRLNQAICSAKNVCNVALMKNRTKFHQKNVPQKNLL